MFSKATVHQYRSPASFLPRYKSVLWRTGYHHVYTLTEGILQLWFGFLISGL
jgi:hypothetical protein